MLQHASLTRGQRATPCDTKLYCAATPPCTPPYHQFKRKHLVISPHLLSCLAFTAVFNISFNITTRLTPVTANQTIQPFLILACPASNHLPSRFLPMLPNTFQQVPGKRGIHNQLKNHPRHKQRHKGRCKHHAVSNLRIP